MTWSRWPSPELNAKPGTLRNASCIERAPWSCKSCCGTTLTDCGMSRSAALPLVAVLLEAGEYASSALDLIVTDGRVWLWAICAVHRAKGVNAK